MDHDAVVQTIIVLHPGVEFSYDGDGSSLGPVEDETGVLLSRGLEWHGDGDGPTLEALEEGWPQAQSDKALTVIKAQRDALLGSSDWTDLPHAPLTDDQKTEWLTYRQALRDWPDQDGFDPLDPPAWPVIPS